MIANTTRSSINVNAGVTPLSEKVRLRPALLAASGSEFKCQTRRILMCGGSVPKAIRHAQTNGINASKVSIERISSPTHRSFEGLSESRTETTVRLQLQPLRVCPLQSTTETTFRSPAPVY